MHGKTEIRVRYEETDQMGMAYHANYLVWMEVGRTELFRGLGLPYRIFEERGLILPVVEARCRYLRPIKYDEVIAVETTVIELTPVKLTFEYTLRDKKSRQEKARGITVHAFVNKEGKPVNAAKAAPDLFAELKANFLPPLQH